MRIIQTMAALVLTVGIGAASQAQPALRAELSTGFHLPMAVRSDLDRPNVLYIAQKTGGLLVARYQKKKGRIKVLSTIPVTMFKGMHATNLRQRAGELFVTLGDHFAAGGSHAGLARIDITDPKNPKLVSLWQSPEKRRGSSHVLIDADVAYLAGMHDGLFVLDISNPARIVEQAQFLPDKHFPKKNPTGVQVPAVRGLALDGEHLYIANDAGGLRIVDVSNPRQPREVAKHINPKVPSKPQAYNKVEVIDGLAYVAIDYCGLEIVDVSNVREPKQIGWWDPWDCRANTNIWFNSPGHTNQLHVDRSRKEVLLSAGDSELVIVDVCDPSAPRLKSQFGEPKNGAGVWGMSVTKNIAYLSYIRTFIPFKGQWSGIKAVALP